MPSHHARTKRSGMPALRARRGKMRLQSAEARLIGPRSARSQAQWRQPTARTVEMRAACHWKQKRRDASTELNPGAALRHLRPHGALGSAQMMGHLQHLMRSAIERACPVFHNPDDKRRNLSCDDHISVASARGALAAAAFVPQGAAAAHHQTVAALVERLQPLARPARRTWSAPPLVCAIASRP
jgi:hypothetical protein